MWRVPKAPSREHAPKGQRSGEACNAPQGWSRPKGRVPKAPSREHAPKGQRSGEARNAPQGVERAERKGEQSEPSIEDSGEAALQTRSP